MTDPRTAHTNEKRAYPSKEVIYIYIYILQQKKKRYISKEKKKKGKVKSYPFRGPRDGPAGPGREAQQPPPRLLHQLRLQTKV